MTQPYINEYFFADTILPEELDQLWASGWRHCGETFFRFTEMEHHDGTYHVVPLRIRLEHFEMRKSQRRIWNKNQHWQRIIRPIQLTDETHLLFRRHKARFKHDAPLSIYNFLSAEPATVPNEAVEVAVYDNDELIAVSYLDLGETATSSIYAMFSPDYASFGLGIFTMLCEIEYSKYLGKTLYYHGYSYQEPSFYDYKKTFNAIEAYNWRGQWAMNNF